MVKLSVFERVVCAANLYTHEEIESDEGSHPFVEREIHVKLPKKVRTLFDDAHYAEATFAAAKFVDRKISKLSEVRKSGFQLMMDAFKDKNPLIPLNSLSTESEIDEQRGYQFIFAGSVGAIRNPRGHEFDPKDDISTCLDHLSFYSMLMRRLEKAGFEI